MNERTFTEESITELFTSTLARIFEGSTFAGLHPSAKGGWAEVCKRYVELFEIKPNSARKNLKDWREGNRIPGAHGLAALASIFNCSVDAFFGGTLEQPFLPSGEIKKIVASVGVNGHVYFVAAEGGFHSTARETAQRFHTILAALQVEGTLPKVTALLSLPHEVHDGDGNLQRRGNHLLALLREFGQVQEDAERLLPFRYFFMDPNLTPIDPTSGARLYLNPGKGNERAFQEVFCSVPGDDSGTRTMWVEIKKEAREEEWKRIRHSIIQVSSPRWGSDRLEVAGRESFRKLFEDSTSRSHYEAVQELRNPLQEDVRALEMQVRELFAGLKGHIEVLEIGSGNFRTSWEYFYRQLNDRDGIHLHVTSVDPIKQDLHPNVKSLEVRRILKKIEEFEVNWNRFDLVIVTHALYRSDPRILTKLLSFVRPGGYLMIVQTSSKSFLHEIVRHTDFFVSPDDEANLEATRSSIASQFTGSFRETSPFRVFAEEQKDWLERHAGAVNCLPLRSRVESRSIFRDTDPTPRGIQVIQYLLGKNKKVDEFLNHDLGLDLMTSLRDLARDGSLHHEELFLWVERKAPSQAWLDRTYPPRSQSDLPPPILPARKAKDAKNSDDLQSPLHHRPDAEDPDWVG